ncbi:hypothetical protein RB653_007653 [Dictyostelium firmibasis]|uniref:Uncharacterized protein n=1 Tax=Dictyostelium firmibasis TaxID=79012 RepID=A0AAN7TP22_9MYCE
MELDKQNLGRLNQLYYSSIGMDLIIQSAVIPTEAQCVKDKLGIPFIALTLVPIFPTYEAPFLLLNIKNLHIPFINKLTHSLFNNKFAKLECKRVDRWRKELGLESLKIEFFENIRNNEGYCKQIAAFDKVLLPNQKVPNDFKSHWNVIGFLFQNEININNIPEKLITFFKDNEINEFTKKEDLPIVFGLGSMPISNKSLQEKIISTLKYTIDKMGKQTKWVILNNWSNFETIDNENVCQLNNVDHLWLYQYSSISITHGGVGSIASILKCAIPSIILPLYFDQPFWSKHINSLGTGIGLNGLKLKQNQLLDSILKIKSNYPQYKNRCLEISSNLSDDSLEMAIKIIENHQN